MPYVPVGIKETKKKKNITINIYRALATRTIGLYYYLFHYKLTEFPDQV